MTNSDNAFLDLIHLAKTASLELAKTVIRLFRNHTKLAIITLYFIVTIAGTLGPWDSNECDVLRGIFSAFVLNEDFEVFTQSLWSNPLTFIDCGENGPPTLMTLVSDQSLAAPITPSHMSLKGPEMQFFAAKER